jgi:hypothetical protein
MLDQTDGKQVAFGVTGTVLIKAGMGRVVKVSVLTAAALALHDCATTGEASAANQIAAIPIAQVGVLDINLPFQKGLVAVAGAGVHAISFN